MKIIDNFLESISNHFEGIATYQHSQISFWGNDLRDNFLQGVNLFNHIEELKPLNGFNDESIDIILILGALNHKSLKQLKDQIQKIEGTYYIIHAPGAFSEVNRKRSYNLVYDLSDVLKIDYTYSKFPVDASDILTVIKELKLGHHDE